MQAPPVRPTASLTAALPESARFVLMDVWSRSGSKYRTRSIILLVINVLLFAGVGSFAFWLRSGVAFAPTMAGYWDQIVQTFHFGRRTSVTLGSLLTEPIGVQYVEMQIWVVGLLMATLICIPILVSILYRFWSSLPFIAIVGFLAVMPWLAITLLGSCLIASVRPFRSRFRFMSALFGLVPTVIYLVLAWGGTREVMAGNSDPVDGIKFLAPWVLAIVAATLVFAIVLLIARLVDYRPGAITPLLTVMFVLPLGLFEFHVGRDELYYRLLEAMDRANFSDVDTSVGLPQAVEDAWLRHPLTGRSTKSIEEIAERQWLFGIASDIDSFQSVLTRHQVELAGQCDWYQKYFPDSRYMPNVLYIRARSWDFRIDPAEFRRTKWIRFYDDFPSVASRSTWQLLAENKRPDSILVGAALLRLAQLEARDGNVDRAIDLLDRLLTTFGDMAHLGAGAVEQTSTRTMEQVLGRRVMREEPELSLHLHADHLLLEGRRLKELLSRNRDPLYGYDPLCGTQRVRSPLWFSLMDLDPRHDRYLANLQLLKTTYPHSRLDDNIDLETAQATEPLSARIARLEQCVQQFPDEDSAAEALYRLAIAYQAHGQAEKAQATFARLLEAWPDSLWAEEAAVSNRVPSAQFTDMVHPRTP